MTSYHENSNSSNFSQNIIITPNNTTSTTVIATTSSIVNDENNSNNNKKQGRKSKALFGRLLLRCVGRTNQNSNKKKAAKSIAPTLSKEDDEASSQAATTRTATLSCSFRSSTKNKEDDSTCASTLRTSSSASLCTTITASTNTTSTAAASTTPVAPLSTPPYKSCLCSSRKGSKNKRVSIKEDQNQYYLSPDMARRQSRTLRQLCWYSAAECHAMMARTNLVTQVWMKLSLLLLLQQQQSQQSSGCSTRITKSLQSNRLLGNENNVLSQVYQSCCRQKEGDEEAFLSSDSSGLQIINALRQFLWSDDSLHPLGGGAQQRRRQQQQPPDHDDDNDDNDGDKSTDASSSDFDCFGLEQVLVLQNVQDRTTRREQLERLLLSYKAAKMRLALASSKSYPKFLRDDERNPTAKGHHDSIDMDKNDPCHTTTTTTTTLEDQLRHDCQAITRPSRLLALAFGQAQQQQEEQRQEEQQPTTASAAPSA
ncbi:hypothetical protein ACA910_008438 [Epithemia clementina (nom. ined.)]